MLQFILGRASSGKTYTVTQKIAECISRGESPVLLVPEQFSFESEKNILSCVGDESAQKVSVISFTRLCDEVERVAGGVCGESITDADRIILMNRAIKLSQNELLRFKSYADSTSFARLMIDSINEFKLNSVSAEDLREAADKVDDDLFKLKLLDTALIYENYDSILSEKFIDSTDRLTKLYEALEDYKYFANKTVFIDSFKGFSGQQYKILERVLSQAQDVIITLTDNPDDKREFGIFSNIKKVKERISKLAAKCDIAEDIVLTRKNCDSEEMAALEDFVATGKTDFEGECKNITLCRADSIYSEADFVARNIRRIVRESKGAIRYSDFVIIARDTATYEDALEVSCKKNNVSCFIDKRIPLIGLPTATAVLSAVNVALSFTTENILRFLKSGIDVLSDDEIATLENYVYLWSIDGKLWQDEWKMNPKGMSSDGPLSKSRLDELDELNKFRQKAIAPLIKFRKAFEGNAHDMARALVHLLDDIDAAKCFKALAKEHNEINYSAAIKQSWDSVMKILNSLCVCFGTTSISKQEFYKALRNALSFESVGVIPQMIDEAVFGAADRIRPSRPKYVFIMGANHGVFPRLQSGNELFANDERQKLMELEIDIPDKKFSLIVDEEHLLYSNLCCASHGVFISYAATIDGSSVAQPSSFVTDIQSAFSCKELTEPFMLKNDLLPESREDAFSLLCNSLADDSSNAETLKKALEDSEYSQRIDSVIAGLTSDEHSLSPEAAQSLFGKKIMMSASKYEDFYKCPFQYFCKHGLKVEGAKTAQIGVLERGNLVHYVLEKTVEDKGKNLALCTEGEISDLIEKYTQEFLDGIAGYAEIETPQLKWIVYTIKRSLKFVVGRLAKEFAQSEFEPVKCELYIGPSGDVPELIIPIDNYGTIGLTGKVDRVDMWNDYIRIVDYKTGTRVFKLPDVLVGQNMQMLIYLYAVIKSKKFGDKSAGVLYMSAKRKNGATPAALKMNGLLAADSTITTAMEKENKGHYVPKFESGKKTDSFIDEADFDKIYDFLEHKLAEGGRAIFNGDIAVKPIDGLDGDACKYCDYQNICHIGDKKHQKVTALTNSETLDEMERQVK